MSNRALLVLAFLAGASLLPQAHGYLPQREERRRSLVSPAREAARALSDSVARLQVLVGLGRIRDSVAAAVRRMPVRDASPILVIGSDRPEALQVGKRLLANLHLPTASKVPVLVAVVDSRVAGVRRSLSGTALALLPDSIRRGDCVVVRIPDRTEAVSPAASDSVPPSWRELNGACAYLARFGMPGPGVRAWLDSRYWDVAGVLPSERPWGRFTGEGGSGIALLDQLLGDPRATVMFGSVALHECAVGKVERCQHRFLTPRPAGLRPPGMTLGVTRGWVELSWEDWAIEPYGWFPQTLLALMVEQLGPEEFSAFWTSELPVEEAFQAATGVSLGEWYGGWIRSEVASAGIAARDDARSWPYAALYVLLALGVVVVAVRRKTVG